MQSSYPLHFPTLETSSLSPFHPLALISKHCNDYNTIYSLNSAELTQKTKEPRSCSMLQTCKRVPWMWFCCVPGPAFIGRSSSSVLMVAGTSVTRTNGTRALAAISRVRYTADREHLEHTRTGISVRHIWKQTQTLANLKQMSLRLKGWPKSWKNTITWILIGFTSTKKSIHHSLHM